MYKRKFFPLALLAGLLLGADLHAQIFVTNSGGGTISEYDLSSGTLINPALVSGLSNPTSIGSTENNLYIQTTSSSNFGGVSPNSYLTEYSLSGSLINPSLVPFPWDNGGLAISGTDLFTFSGVGSSVAEYDASSGSVVNDSLSIFPTPLSNGLMAASGANLLIAFPPNYGVLRSGSVYPGIVSGYNLSGGSAAGTFSFYGVGSIKGMVASGNDVFICGIITTAGSPSTVACVPAVAEYDATTGNLINSSLVAGLTNPTALAIYGNDLYVLDSGDGTIGEYDTTTGDPINPALVTGLGNATDFTVVPEPGAWVLFGFGFILLLSRIITGRFTKQSFVIQCAPKQSLGAR